MDVQDENIININDKIKLAGNERRMKKIRTLLFIDKQKKLKSK